MTREHAIIQKKVINLDHQGDKKVMCAWDDCERDGFDLYKCTVNYGKPGYDPQIVKYVFCTERHRQYWINSHRKYGNLPSGSACSF